MHIVAVDQFQRIWQFLLLAFGLLFLFVGMGFCVFQIRFGQAAISTYGTIVDVQIDDSGEGPNYIPVVEFTSRNAEKIRFEGTSTNPRPTLNARVRVLYRETSPDNACIDSFVQRWLFPSVFAPIGLLLILAAFKDRLLFKHTSLLETPADGTGNLPAHQKEMQIDLTEGQ